MDIDAGAAARPPSVVARRLVAGARARAPRRGHARPPRGARRRRLRGHLFQVGGYRPATRDRLRDAQALRAAPDDRRHARRRRDHARAADHPRAARRLPRHGGAVPGRPPAPLRQPDGDALLGGRRGEPDPDRRALPLRPAHRRRARRATSGCPPGEIDHRVAGINHIAFFLRLERDGRGSLPARSAEVDRRRSTTASATRCCDTSAPSSPSPPSTSPSTSRGSSRTAAGPDRALQRARSTSTRGAARRRSPSGTRSRAELEAARRSPPPSAATSTGRTSSARARPACRSASTATCRTASATGS